MPLQLFYYMSQAERVFHLAINGNTIEQKKACDIVIETKEAQSYGMFEAAKADELYTIGYEAAIEALDKFDWDEYGNEDVYIPKMMWKEMYEFSPDAVLMVLASTHYDGTENIRDYEEYKKEMGAHE